MDELTKGLALSMVGPGREAALARCRQCLADWGVEPPAVEPLVLDFGLGDFERMGLIEYWIANEATAGYCGKYLFVFAGQTCPRHRHRIKHETFFLVKGRLEVEVGGHVQLLAPGAVLSIPPGSFHRFTGIKPSLLLELSMPCAIEDNHFENTAIHFRR